MKKTLITLTAIAVAGAVGYWIWKNSRPASNEDKASSCGCGSK